jgi:preprotein translocase subunit SecE
MARQTRAQRRARRAEAPRDGAPAERSRAVQTGMPRARALPSREAVADRIPGGGVRRFIGESWGELKKVEWPGQAQLIQGVVVVLIACLIVGVFLWGADLIFKRLVQDVLL